MTSSLRSARWTLALLLPLSLTGCAGLATSSAVHAEQPISNAAVPNLDVQVLPPQAGDSAQAIVTGFLRAGPSLVDDYGVARQYLTAAASAKWQPAAGAVITTGEAGFTYVTTKSGQVTVSAVQQAGLDASGHVTDTVPDRRTRASFGVTRVHGQWRISSLPTGFLPWFSDVDFQRVFSAHEIYYPSATMRVLVPDVQWYPDNGLATAVARAVLAAPPGWLRGAVRTPSQSGIRLAINAVPVDLSTGVASIDLKPSALTADGHTRTALWAAMTATLTSVPNVTRVELTVSGHRLTAPSLPAEPLAAADFGYQSVVAGSGALITRTGSELSWRTPGMNGPLPRSGSAGNRPVRLPAVGPTVYDIGSDTSGSTLAAVTTDRRSLTVWTNRSPHVVPTFAGNLTRPSFTGHTAILAGITGASKRGKTASSGAGVWAVDTDVAPAALRAKALAVPWLGRSTVLALKVSSEGARVAMVVRDSKGVSSVRLASLQRNARGVPTGIGKPIELPVDIASIVDVAWLDDDSLAVLGASKVSREGAVGPSTVADLPLSGEATPFSAPAGVQNVVAAGTGLGNLYVLDQRGGVWAREGAGWVRQPGISDVAAPGG